MLSVIILAGRFDEKICHKTSKSLILDDNGISVLEHQLSNLDKVHVSKEIIIVSSNNSDRIYKRSKKYKVRIVENQLSDITNEVEDLRLGLLNTSDNDTNRYLVINSNIIFSPSSIYDILTGTKISCSKEESGKQKAGISIVNNSITYFSFNMPYCWNNISYFMDKEAKLFKQLCFNKNYKALFMFEILNKMLEDKIKLNPIFQTVQVINKTKDFNEEENNENPNRSR